MVPNTQFTGYWVSFILRQVAASDQFIRKLRIASFLREFKAIDNA